MAVSASDGDGGDEINRDNSDDGAGTPMDTDEDTMSDRTPRSPSTSSAPAWGSNSSGSEPRSGEVSNPGVVLNSAATARATATVSTAAAAAAMAAAAKASSANGSAPTPSATSLKNGKNVPKVELTGVHSLLPSVARAMSIDDDEVAREAKGGLSSPSASSDRRNSLGPTEAFPRGGNAGSSNGGHALAPGSSRLAPVLPRPLRPDMCLAPVVSTSAGVAVGNGTISSGNGNIRGDGGSSNIGSYGTVADAYDSNGDTTGCDDSSEYSVGKSATGGVGVTDEVVVTVSASPVGRRASGDTFLQSPKLKKLAPSKAEGELNEVPKDREIRATKTWSIEELQMLWELKTKDPNLPPNRVAELMWRATGIRKTGDQCRTRWTKVDDPSIRKGSWTAKEDGLLLEAVRDRTTGDAPPPWVEISDKVFGGKRTSKQCRARYMNHLDPDLRHDPWSLAENAALKAAADAYGGRQIKWASIVKDVKELRGRSPDAARNQHKMMGRPRSGFKAAIKPMDLRPLPHGMPQQQQPQQQQFRQKPRFRELHLPPKYEHLHLPRQLHLPPSQSKLQPRSHCLPSSLSSSLSSLSSLSSFSPSSPSSPSCPKQNQERNYRQGEVKKEQSQGRSQGQARLQAKSEGDGTEMGCLQGQYFVPHKREIPEQDGPQHEQKHKQEPDPSGDSEDIVSRVSQPAKAKTKSKSKGPFPLTQEERLHRIPPSLLMTPKHRFQQKLAENLGIKSSPQAEAGGVLHRKRGPEDASSPHDESSVSRDQLRVLAPLSPPESQGIERGATAGRATPPGVNELVTTDVSLQLPQSRQGETEGQSQPHRQQMPQSAMPPGFPSPSMPSALHRPFQSERTNASLVTTLSTVSGVPSASAMLPRQTAPSFGQPPTHEAKSPSQAKQDNQQNVLFQEQLQRQQEMLQERHRQQLLQQQFEQHQQQLQLQKRQQHQQQQLLRKQQQQAQKIALQAQKLGTHQRIVPGEDQPPGSPRLLPRPAKLSVLLPRPETPSEAQLGSRPESQPEVKSESFLESELYPEPDAESRSPRQSDSTTPLSPSSRPGLKSSPPVSPSPSPPSKSPSSVSARPFQGSPSSSRHRDPQPPPGYAFLGPPRLQQPVRQKGSLTAMAAVALDECRSSGLGAPTISSSAMSATPSSPETLVRDSASSGMGFPGAGSGKEDVPPLQSSPPPQVLPNPVATSTGLRPFQRLPVPELAPSPFRSISASRWPPSLREGGVVGVSNRDIRVLAAPPMLPPPHGQLVSAAAVGAAAAALSAEVAAASVDPLRGAFSKGEARAGEESSNVSPNINGESSTSARFRSDGQVILPGSSALAVPGAQAARAGEASSGPLPMEEDAGVPGNSVQALREAFASGAVSSSCAILASVSASSTVPSSVTTAVCSSAIESSSTGPEANMTPMSVSMASLNPEAGANGQGSPHDAWHSEPQGALRCPQFRVAVGEPCPAESACGWVDPMAYQCSSQPAAAGVRPLPSNRSQRLDWKPGVGLLPGFSSSSNGCDRDVHNVIVEPSADRRENGTGREDVLRGTIREAMMVDAGAAGAKPLPPGVGMPMEVEALLALKEGFWPNGMHRAAEMGVKFPT